MEGFVLTPIDGAAVATAIAVSRWLKRAAWFETKLIPLASLVVTGAIVFGDHFGLLPTAPASATPLVAAINWKSLAVVVARWVIDTIAASGAQSAPKNVKQGIELVKARRAQGLTWTGHSKD